MHIAANVWVDIWLWGMLLSVTLGRLGRIPSNLCFRSVFGLLTLLAAQSVVVATIGLQHGHQIFSGFEIFVPTQLVTLFLWSMRVGPDTRVTGANGRLLSVTPSRLDCKSGAAVSSATSDAPVLLASQTVFSTTSRCPVCACGIEAEAVLCCKCETPHHTDCWEYAKRCATFGCGEPGCRAVSHVVKQKVYH
jgi:hypothetical protein